MINTKQLLFFLIAFNVSYQFNKNECILSKLIPYVKEHSLKQSGKNLDKLDSTIRILQSIGNRNQNSLLLKLISNFEILPEGLKDEIKTCENELDYLVEKCEHVYGAGNCEIINKFTVG